MIATETVTKNKLKVSSLVGLAITFSAAGIAAFLLVTEARVDAPLAAAVQPTIASLTADMTAKATAYKTISKAARPAALTALKKVGIQRKAMMKTLLASNPKKFVQTSLTLGRLRTFPASMSDLLEQPVTVTGKISVVQTDDFIRGTASKRVFITTTNKKQTELFFSTPALAVQPGASYTIQGTTLDDSLVVTGVKPTNVPTSPAVAPTNQKVAIIIFNFTNDTSVPITPEAARAIVYNDTNSVRAYYRETSFDLTTITGKNNLDGITGKGDVYGPVTIPYSNNGCYEGPYLYDWDYSALNALDLNDGTYDRYIFVHPQVSTCPWAAAAQAPGKFVSINGGQFFTLAHVGHEVGHLFGASHAGSYFCFDSAGQPVTLSTNCYSGQQSDQDDIMANNSTHQMNAFHKMQAGWLPPSEIQNVTPTTTVTSYTLYPMDIPSTQVKVLVIPWRGDGPSSPFTHLAVEFRRPSGEFDNFSENDPVVNGASIRIIPDPAIAYAQYSSVEFPTKILDATPNISGNALPVGQTFTDPISGIIIHVDSLAADKSSITVSISQSCGHTNPSMQVNYPDAVKPGQGTPYTIQVTNNDNASCGPSTFTVTPTPPAGWTGSPTTLTMSNVAPLAMASATYTLTSPLSATDGTYSFDIRAVNTNFQTYQTQVPWYAIIDGTAPKMSIEIDEPLPENGAVPIYAVITDETSYVTTATIRIDNQVVQTCSGPLFDCAYDWVVDGLSSGSHSIAVQATDVAGSTGYVGRFVCKNQCTGGPILPLPVPTQ